MRSVYMSLGGLGLECWEFSSFSFTILDMFLLHGPVSKLKEVVGVWLCLTNCDVCSMFVAREA